MEIINKTNLLNSMTLSVNNINHDSLSKDLIICGSCAFIVSVNINVNGIVNGTNKINQSSLNRKIIGKY